MFSIFIILSFFLSLYLNMFMTSIDRRDQNFLCFFCYFFLSSPFSHSFVLFHFIFFTSTSLHAFYLLFFCFFFYFFFYLFFYTHWVLFSTFMFTFTLYFNLLWKGNDVMALKTADSYSHFLLFIIHFYSFFCFCYCCSS